MKTAKTITSGARTITMVRPLDDVDASELARCEGVIERGMATVCDVGMALRHIRDERLYRATHGTFEAYCLERWKLSKTHVNRQIKAADIARDLAPIGVKATHEAQLRPLASLPAEVRRTVWKQAVEQSGGEQPTAFQVEVSKRFVCGLVANEARTRKGNRLLRKALHRAAMAVEKREPERIDFERKMRAGSFVRAIKVFSEPVLDIPELATDILAMNVPNWESSDCISKVVDARDKLTLLLEALQEPNGIGNALPSLTRAPTACSMADASSR